MRSRILTGGVALLAPFTLALPHAAAGSPSVRVAHVVQIVRQGGTTPGAGGQSDVVVQAQVAADPGRPGLAAAVTQEGLQKTAGGTFGVALGLAVTRDGGRHWASRVVPGVTVAAGGHWLGISWPTVAVARDGSIYVVAALRTDDPCHTGLGVIRSTDGGRTFGPLVLVQAHTACGVLEGRSSLAIDDGRVSRHRGRLYLAWTSYRTDASGNETGQVQTLSYSAAGGRQWSKPVDIGAADSFTYGNTLVVGADGQLTDVYGGSSADFSVSYVAASNSYDGGRTFGRSVQITVNQFPTVGGQDIRCCAPSAAIDPVTGEIYAAFSDARYERGTYDDALLVRSHDGVHWSAPVVANTTHRGVEHLTPEVGAYGGDVFVTWARTSDPNGPAVQQEIAASRDGGYSFGVPSAAGPRGDLHYAATSAGFGYWLGDVTGIAAVRGGAYLAWPLPTVPPGVRPQHQTLFAATASVR